jgi:hypothetical protein
MKPLTLALSQGERELDSLLPLGEGRGVRVVWRAASFGGYAWGNGRG